MMFWRIAEDTLGGFSVCNFSWSDLLIDNTNRETTQIEKESTGADLFHCLSCFPFHLVCYFFLYICVIYMCAVVWYCILGSCLKS